MGCKCARKVFLITDEHHDLCLEKGIVELRDGDRFRMDEPDGTPVKDKQGRTVWTVTGEPYLDPKHEGNHAVNTLEHGGEDALR